MASYKLLAPKEQSYNIRPFARKNIYTNHYLLTITKQNRYSYSEKSLLMDIKKWLECNGVKFNAYVIEAHGLHGIHHLHALVYYDGTYRHLCGYGDGEHVPKYSINFRPIDNFKKAIDYITKYNIYELEQQTDIHISKYHYLFDLKKPIDI